MTTVFLTAFWIHGSTNVGTVLGEALAYDLAGTLRLDLAVLGALSILLWGIAVLVWTRAFKLLRAGERAEQVRVMVKARGTVMTETLIALPVLLLLVFGLCQLTLNTTASIFTSLAAFQASRTVYIWHPETDVGWARNGGLSHADVEEKARISAASVLAPVTPSDYIDTGCNTSGDFENKLSTMMSVTLGRAANFGVTSAAGVRAIATGRPLPVEGNKLMATAYDSDNFIVRGPVKLYIAYCHTTVTYTERNGLNRTAVFYDHKQTMPLVARIFGRITAIGAFSDIERTFEMPVNVHPNPAPPTSIFALLNFNPFKAWQ